MGLETNLHRRADGVYDVRMSVPTRPQFRHRSGAGYACMKTTEVVPRDGAGVERQMGFPEDVRWT
jgi:hypothetical protein